MSEMRSRHEIDELRRTLAETYQIVSTEPGRLVKITGGNVPNGISNIQVIYTQEMLACMISICDYMVKAESADIVMVAAKTTLDKLKAV
jgi:hypothetical protein